MGKYFLFEISLFLTAILHRGLRNDFFFIFFSQFTFSNFYYFGLLFLFSLFSLDFLPLLFSFYFRLTFVLFSFPLFYLDFYSIAVTFWISSKFFYFVLLTNRCLWSRMSVYALDLVKSQIGHCHFVNISVIFSWWFNVIWRDFELFFTNVALWEWTMYQRRTMLTLLHAPLLHWGSC